MLDDEHCRDPMGLYETMLLNFGSRVGSLSNGNCFFFCSGAHSLSHSLCLSFPTSAKCVLFHSYSIFYGKDAK